MILHSKTSILFKKNMYHWLSLRSDGKGHHSCFSSICSSFGFGLLSQMCIYKYINAYMWYLGEQMPSLAVGVSHVVPSKIVLLWRLAIVTHSKLDTWPNSGQQNRRAHLWLRFSSITSPNWMQHSQSICNTQTWRPEQPLFSKFFILHSCYIRVWMYLMLLTIHLKIIKVINFT